MAVDTPVPPALAVGRGQALCVGGWCYHPLERITKLDVLVGGESRPVRVFGLPRPDVARSQGPERDPRGHSRRSGFWTYVLLHPVEEPVRIDLRLQATLAGGRRCTRPIGKLKLKPGGTRPAAGGNPGRQDAATDAGSPAAAEPRREHRPRRPVGPGARVAICMTTCDPPLALFEAQVRSIRAQAHRNWICLVADDCSQPPVYERLHGVLAGDARFRLTRNESRLGFYRNFERCLGGVPADADFVALSDHDDRWHPDKLEALLAAFRPGMTLVYSDMNVVDESGRVLATTYWTSRRNNHTRLSSLLVANTITGAASLFPVDLLDYLLPFPPAVGRPFHDHWIGAVALALGHVGYVDRALYDYVQHERNVIGHHAPARRGLAAFGRDWWIGLAPADKRNGSLRARAGALKGRWRATYEADVLRLQVLTAVLELRGRNAITGRKRRTLRRIQRMDESPAAFAWLALRGLLPGGPGNVTLGAERKLAGAILWRRLSTLAA
jgi:glycosyltransferase involved in cell wall biosynthesis